MPQTPAHDWMLPKLTQLLAEAAQAGIPRDVAVATLTDLVEGPAFNTPEMRTLGLEDEALNGPQAPVPPEV